MPFPLSCGKATVVCVEAHVERGACLREMYTEVRHLATIRVGVYAPTGLPPVVPI
jgi:hypothetical protein